MAKAAKKAAKRYNNAKKKVKKSTKARHFKAHQIAQAEQVKENKRKAKRSGTHY